MTESLVERLFSVADDGDHLPDNSVRISTADHRLLREAADRIAALESERDSLNAKIDAAPHGIMCSSHYDHRIINGPCDCWKASSGDDELRHVKAQAIRDAANYLDERADLRGADILRHYAKRIEAGE